MQNKKGLSDVVTTVIIVALSLVAIAIVWVVVNNLISENASTIENQGGCLTTNLEIVSVSSSCSIVNVTVKKISGDTEIGGVKVIAYNAAGASVNGSITGTMTVGDQKTTSITIANANKVSATPYFIVDNKQVVCSNSVEKSI